MNNNAVESHHALMKDFYKVRREVTEVQTYLDGFKVFHNFVRKNARDKLTPAENGELELMEIEGILFY